MFLAKIFQMGSSFIQLYYLLTVRVYFIGKDLSQEKVKSETNEKLIYLEKASGVLSRNYFKR